MTKSEENDIKDFCNLLKSCTNVEKIVLKAYMDGMREQKIISDIEKQSA